MLHLKCTCITLPQLTPPPPGCHFTKRPGVFAVCKDHSPFSKDLSGKLKVVDYSRGSCGKSRPHERCHLAPYGGRRQLSFYWRFLFTAHQLRSWRTLLFLQQPTCWPASARGAAHYRCMTVEPWIFQTSLWSTPNWHRMHNPLHKPHYRSFIFHSINCTVFTF